MKATYQHVPPYQVFRLDYSEEAIHLDLSSNGQSGSAGLTNITGGFNWQDTTSWADATTPLLPALSSAQTSMDNAVPDDSNFRTGHLRGFWPENIQDSLLASIVNLYLRQFHPSIPIFRAFDLTSRMANGQYRTDRQFGAMILALCTFTLLQPQQPNSSLLAEVSLTTADFLREANYLHSANSIGQDPTLDTILTNLYLFVSLDLLRQKNAARLRLQEAITISDILGLHDPGISDKYDTDEWEKRTRIYLFLTVVER
jgi:hypothetical protein